MCVPDLSQRVNSVKEENHKLKAENEVGLLSCLSQMVFLTGCVLSIYADTHGPPPPPPQLLDQYIDNLMATSTFFSKTSTAPPPRSSKEEQSS